MTINAAALKLLTLLEANRWSDRSHIAVDLLLTDSIEDLRKACQNEGLEVPPRLDGYVPVPPGALFQEPLPDECELYEVEFFGCIDGEEEPDSHQVFVICEDLQDAMNIVFERCDDSALFGSIISIGCFEKGSTV